MAKQNSITPIIREVVKQWLINVSRETFTVPDIVYSLQQLEELATVDLAKAVSNELIRLEGNNVIECVGIDHMTHGRPPKLYAMKYCQPTLEVLAKGFDSYTLRIDQEHKINMIKNQSGLVRFIFPTYAIHRVTVLKELVEFHKIRLDQLSR